LISLQTTPTLVVASYEPFCAIAREDTMTTSLEVLEAEALKLAPADRSRLLERLIASLDANPEIEDAWELEADRREASLESGSVAEVRAQDAMGRLRSRLAR
jgi:Putative addiction module component